MGSRLQKDRKPVNLSTVVRRWVIATVVGITPFACGPSVSSIYEGNIRFEHCYRLDLDPNIAPSHREACWREWASRYTYGQTRDRLDYSRRRISRLAAGDTSRPQLDLSAPAIPVTAPAVEAPVNARKSPPPMTATIVAPPPDAGPPAGPNPPEIRARFEAVCVQKCGDVLNSCGQKCPKRPDAGAVPCEPCAGDYRSCMRRCFE